LSPDPVLQSIDRLTEPPPTGSELGVALSAQPLGPIGVLDQFTVFVGEGVNAPWALLIATEYVVVAPSLTEHACALPQLAALPPDQT
jgi:hypothetical protein